MTEPPRLLVWDQLYNLVLSADRSLLVLRKTESEPDCSVGFFSANYDWLTLELRFVDLRGNLLAVSSSHFSCFASRSSSIRKRLLMMSAQSSKTFFGTCLLIISLASFFATVLSTGAFKSFLCDPSADASRFVQSVLPYIASVTCSEERR